VDDGGVGDEAGAGVGDDDEGVGDEAGAGVGDDAGVECGDDDGTTIAGTMAEARLAMKVLPHRGRVKTLRCLALYMANPSPAHLFVGPPTEAAQHRPPTRSTSA
jgi:hypothetical protein